MFDLVVAGGRVVCEDGVCNADIGITDGTIAEIAEPGALSQGGRAVRTLDARGLIVAPGGVDSHCHIEQKTSTGLTPCDDFHSASVAALCGGTTTIVPFACQHRGRRIASVVAEYRSLAAKAACDYAFHIIVADPSEAHCVDDLRACFAQGGGYSSVKVYMTYDALKLRDAELLDVLELCRAAGAMVMVHAESDGMIGWITSRLLKAGHVAPKFHGAARPDLAEREATHRAITFAEYVATPLLVVHVSSAAAAAEIARARAERGSPIYGETCPQYLTLTSKKLQGTATGATTMHGHEGHAHHGHAHASSANLEGEWEGAKYLCSPPLRGQADIDALWAALRDGALQVVSSDHSAYSFAPHSSGNPAYKLAKPLAERAFTSVPMGLPGLETRLPLLFSAGVQAGRIDLRTFAAVCATNPAKLYGLYPRKGVIAVGADADFAIFDPATHLTLTHAALHDALDYTPYEGMALDGALAFTVLRGEVVFQKGCGGEGSGDVVRAPRGSGQFIASGRPDLLGWAGGPFPCDSDVVLDKASRL